MEFELKKELLCLRACIENRAVAGKDADRLVALYKKLSGDVNYKEHCKSCQIDMLNYMTAQLLKISKK